MKNAKAIGKDEYDQLIPDPAIGKPGNSHCLFQYIY